MKFKLLSIDAHPSPSGWTWNDSHTLHPGIEFDKSDITPRKIAKRLREMHYLSEASKGKIHFEFVDESLIEIQLNTDNQPIFALQTLEEE